MTENQAMSEDRLAEVLRWGAITMGARKEGTREAGRMLVEAAKEIDRLRAENERLRERCECEKCFRCKDIIPEGNAIYYDSDGDPFCSRCWAVLERAPVSED